MTSKNCVKCNKRFEPMHWLPAYVMFFLLFFPFAITFVMATIHYLEHNYSIVTKEMALFLIGLSMFLAIKSLHTMKVLFFDPPLKMCPHCRRDVMKLEFSSTFFAIIQFCFKAVAFLFAGALFLLVGVAVFRGELPYMVGSIYGLLIASLFKRVFIDSPGQPSSPRRTNERPEKECGPANPPLLFSEKNDQ